MGTYEKEGIATQSQQILNQGMAPCKPGQDQRICIYDANHAWKEKNAPTKQLIDEGISASAVVIESTWAMDWIAGTQSRHLIWSLASLL